MQKKADDQSKSPFGYRLVDRKPKPGVVIGAIIGLVVFMAFFYFLGQGQVH